MRTVIVVIITVVLIVSFAWKSCPKVREMLFRDKHTMAPFVNPINNDNGYGFLKAHRLLEPDTEHIDFIDSLLQATLEKDTDGMKRLFAKDAIQEVGDETMDDMIKKFITYCRFTTYSISIPIGPATDQLYEADKNYKILKGPLELQTDTGEYRLAVKCCAYNEGEPDDVGIWSLYIIEKEKDSEQDTDYRGDLKYRTGIYFDVARMTS